MTPFTGFVAVISGLAWGVLLLGGGPMPALPTLCTGGVLLALPAEGTWVYRLSAISAPQLAASWMVMLLAMMLPTAVRPVAYLRSRVFRKSESGAVSAFIAGYLGVWVLAALPLIGIALAMRLIFPLPGVPFALALGLAIFWQAVPTRQFALNKCHGRPALPGFGSSTLGSCLGYGIDHGFWCLTACAPVMLMALTAPAHSPLWMALAALWIWAERMEAPKRPEVRFRMPMRAVRMGRHRLLRHL